MAPPNSQDFIVTLQGQRQRMLTFGQLVPPEGDPVPSRNDLDLDIVVRGRDFKNLRELLTLCKIQQLEEKKYFWSDAWLRDIMTKDRVTEELRRMRERYEARAENCQSFKSRTIEWYVDKICPRMPSDENFAYGARNCIQGKDVIESESKSYLKIFTILLMCQRKADIGKFIEHEVCDGDLPLAECETVRTKVWSARSRRGPLCQRLECFKGWKVSEIEMFQDHQYRVLVPFFAQSSGTATTTEHVSYFPGTILPWIEELPANRGYGGYGHVSCLRPHPTSHGFHNCRQVRAGGGLFAAKIITTQKPKDFENEAKILRLVSGHHEHLITLLATFSHNGISTLLFPWADCDLEIFWTKEKPPYDPQTGIMDLETMRWVSGQILGLISAVNYIHYIPHLASEYKKYARHGDIKPENVLCFPRNGHTDCFLVIADFGISAIHGDKSKSNVPNETLPRSPDYRPPECDQKGGAISQAFDVWTMGCLLMEMICWVLGGKEMLAEFDRDRRLISYMGAKSNIWFDVKRLKDGGKAILVKETVVQWMRKLNDHPGCTEYLHDLLDIIHERMIVVLSKEVNRIRSQPLLEKVKAMHIKVGEDPRYGQAQGQPRSRYEDPVAVRTEMNTSAEERIRQFEGLLQTYSGTKTQKAKTELEMKSVDEASTPSVT